MFNMNADGIADFLKLLDFKGIILYS